MVYTNMSNAESVSRGCFAFKAKGKKRVARAEDYLPKERKNALIQFEVFQRMWEEVNNEIQVLRSDLNCKIFEDLVSFVNCCHETYQRRSSIREIPVAALITGVNTPDHAIMFTNLSAMLKERVTSLVATLRARDCATVKSLLSKLLAQLLQRPDLLSSDEDDTRCTVTQHSCSMMTLVKHYNALGRNRKSPCKSSPTKRRLSSNNPDPHAIIIILEDIENFAANILQDFIVTCSNYMDSLPLVLVLGIATSVTAVHHLLPTAVSSLLCMEMFQAPPSTQYLTLLIDKVLMTNKFPFKLGPRVFQFLLDMFLCHHFSVIHFVTAFEYCMMQHYMSNPLSQLCCPQDMTADMVKQLSDKDVRCLRQLPSVMRYIEQLPKKEAVIILQNDDHFKKLIQSLLAENHTAQLRSNSILQLLHSLTSHLPTHPLGKQIRELYALCLESSIHETAAFTQAFDLLGLTARDELTRLVSDCMNHICGTSDLVLNNVHDTLRHFLFRMNHLDEESVEESADIRVATEELKLQRTDLRSLQKKLQELGKQKKVTPYEKVRQELLNYVKGIIRNYLPHSESMALYEVLYYDDIATVRHHLNASPRSAIHQALSNPAYYLQCTCCAVSDGGISPTMPDICIAYKLHTECGQLINLYDWLQAFASILTADKSENVTKSSKPDKAIQARFIQAVSELQFLGFIKPTRRKTDHMARLTWGGC